MLVTLYHFEKLPLNIRTEFDIPAWAYAEATEHQELFKNYMRFLTVFYYNDSDAMVGGRNVNYPIYIKPKEDEPLVPPELAYTSSVYVDKYFRPIKWPANNPKGRLILDQLKANLITSDMMAWAEWNVPITNIGFTPTSIRRDVITDQLDPKLCVKGKCFNKD